MINVKNKKRDSIIIYFNFPIFSI